MFGKNSHSVFLFFLLGFFGVIGGGRAQAGEGESGRAFASVDVSFIITHYKKVFDIQGKVDEAFESRKKALEQDYKKLVEEAKEIVKMKSQLPADSELLFDSQTRFQKKDLILRKEEKRLKGEIESRLFQEMKTILNEIRGAIRSVAERERIPLVLRAPDAGEMAAAEPEGKKEEEGREEKETAGGIHEEIRAMLRPRSTYHLLGKFRRNPVLFGASGVDITQKVLDVLNGEYQKAQGKKEGESKPHP